MIPSTELAIATSPDGSPILTSDVGSITELFSRNPMLWDEAQTLRAIEHYRTQRVRLGEKADKATAKPKAQKVALEGDASSMLSQLNLGL